MKTEVAAPDRCEMRLGVADHRRELRRDRHAEHERDDPQADVAAVDDDQRDATTTSSDASIDPTSIQPALTRRASHDRDAHARTENPTQKVTVTPVAVSASP